MKYLSIIRYLFIAISVLVVVLAFALSPAGADPNVDMMLRWMYVLLGLSVASAILAPLFSIARNPKSAVRSIIGLVVIVLVAIIAYNLSSDEPVQAATKIYDDPMELRLSDMGLFTTYVVFACAIISIVVTEIINAFK